MCVREREMESKAAESERAQERRYWRFLRRLVSEMEYACGAAASTHLFLPCLSPHFSPHFIAALFPTNTHLPLSLCLFSISSKSTFISLPPSHCATLPPSPFSPADPMMSQLSSAARQLRFPIIHIADIALAPFFKLS